MPLGRLPERTAGSAPSPGVAAAGAEAAVTTGAAAAATAREASAAAPAPSMSFRRIEILSHAGSQPAPEWNSTPKLLIFLEQLRGAKESPRRKPGPMNAEARASDRGVHGPRLPPG